MPEAQTKQLRVALYARVSTEEQKEGQTIQAQIAELERCAKDRDYAVVHIYKDEAWSGSMLARPALDRLRDDATKGLFDAVIVNGGTGIAPRDVTIEAVRPLLDKELEGFGELFRMLSYQEIGSAAFLSRAVAGVRDGRFIAALPGSTGGCRLAMEKLIVPELGHIAYLLTQ